MLKLQIKNLNIFQNLSNLKKSFKININDGLEDF